MCTCSCITPIHSWFLCKDCWKNQHPVFSREEKNTEQHAQWILSPHTLDRPIRSCGLGLGVTAPSLGAVHLAWRWFFSPGNWFFPPTGEVFQPKLVTTRLKVNRLPRYFRGRVVRIDQYKYQRTPSKELSWQQRQSQGFGGWRISVITLIYFGNLMSLPALLRSDLHFVPMRVSV